jgi:hypothetical protein
MLKITAEKLWGDESGFIVSTDLILISSILVIGLLVGLVSVRDQIVQELGDVAVAVGNLNQSYSFAAHPVTFVSHGATYTFTVAGSNFTDTTDIGETGSLENNTGVGISVTQGASNEK